MNYDKLHLAIAHYRSIHDRLNFGVREIEDSNKHKRYTVHPMDQGVATNYGTYDTEAEAQTIANDYNERSESFLSVEYLRMKTVILQSLDENPSDKKAIH